MGNRALFAKGVDDVSIPKKLAGVFARERCGDIRFIPPRGWLARGDDGFWRPDPASALKASREFCDATARIIRSIAITGAAMAAEVLRLAELEPAFREPLPEGEVLRRAWL
jgi:hypothetical protein